MHGGWRSRGYLPHFERPGATQFITWHLADSLPSEVLAELHQYFSRKTPEERKREWYSQIEKHLDAGHGSLLLRNPVAGIIVQDVLLRNHKVMYELHAWCVMPNHVHALLTQFEGCGLAKILQKLKGRSSFEIGRKLTFEKPLWQVEYCDRMIRDEEHFHRVAEYIEWNPVKAKLCVSPTDWTYSSANPENRDLLQHGD